MPNIEIGRDFFVKERKTMYANWGFALNRELIQNSVDAGSKNITITTSEVDDPVHGKYVRFVFNDDGCGMTEEVLNSVYFSLGRSTKDGKSGVGGFGRARILTCFSMVYYKIMTLDNIVDGSGARYDLFKSETPFKGCSVEIGVDETTERALIGHLMDYIKMSDLSCTITLNGEIIVKNPWDKGEMVRELFLDGAEDSPFAKVYVSKGDGDNYMYIRVHGTLMYREYTGIPLRVIMELDPNRSREILTANRDNLHDTYRKKVADYRDLLLSNTKIASKSMKDRVKVISENSGMLKNSAIRKLGREPEADLAHMEEAGYGLGEMADIISGIDYLSLSPERKHVLATVLHSNPELVSNFNPLPSVMFYRDTTDEKLIEISDKYRPSNWKYRLDKGKVIWTQGAECARLLMTWKYLCEEAVKAMIASGRIDEIEWSVGWVFDTSFGALADKSAKGVHYLLNPLGWDLKPRFSLRDSASLKRMMAEAKHEVAHTVSMFHDEKFANALTSLDSEFREWEVLRTAITLKI